MSSIAFGANFDGGPAPPQDHGNLIRLHRRESEQQLQQQQQQSLEPLAANQSYYQGLEPAQSVTQRDFHPKILHPDDKIPPLRQRLAKYKSGMKIALNPDFRFQTLASCTNEDFAKPIKELEQSKEAEQAAGTDEDGLGANQEEEEEDDDETEEPEEPEQDQDDNPLVHFMPIDPIIEFTQPPSKPLLHYYSTYNTPTNPKGSTSDSSNRLSQVPVATKRSIYKSSVPTGDPVKYPFNSFTTTTCDAFPAPPTDLPAPTFPIPGANITKSFVSLVDGTTVPAVFQVSTAHEAFVDHSRGLGLANDGGNGAGKSGHGIHGRPKSAGKLLTGADNLEYPMGRNRTTHDSVYQSPTDDDRRRVDPYKPRNAGRSLLFPVRSEHSLYSTTMGSLFCPREGIYRVSQPAATDAAAKTKASSIAFGDRRHFDSHGAPIYTSA
ncbi:hypothetical protein HDU76_012367 [Blyttiomyces sp. JEL0837]|nr:hypothetical protein HDU76_012367 [Blyttiomyces sp. JEL0837]